MEKAIIILAYYGYKDPVFQSAVLPYFLNFPDPSLRFVLVTYENARFPLSLSERGEIQELLEVNRIIWIPRKWRSGQFKVFKKLYDFLSSILAGIKLAKKYNACALYSEGFPGSIIGFYISRLARVKHLVHTFEPHAEYMIEAGIWKRWSWEALLVNWHIRKIARHASYLLTGTRYMIDLLKGQGIKESVVFRVPSCVDVNHFRFASEARNAIRQQLGIAAHQQVLVYLGKFGGMYMENEAFEFFRVCQETMGAWILIISMDKREKITRLAEKSDLNALALTVISLQRSEIPRYLSAADVGFVGVRQWPSKKYCSPIKTGEYLSCGLPVIIPKGISDDGSMLVDAGIGVMMESSEKKSYEKVINDWKSMLGKATQGDIRDRARTFVVKDRSIQKYQHLYRKIFESL